MKKPQKFKSKPLKWILNENGKWQPIFRATKARRSVWSRVLKEDTARAAAFRRSVA